MSGCRSGPVLRARRIPSTALQEQPAPVFLPLPHVQALAPHVPSPDSHGVAQNGLDGTFWAAAAVLRSCRLTPLQTPHSCCVVQPMPSVTIDDLLPAAALEARNAIDSGLRAFLADQPHQLGCDSGETSDTGGRQLAILPLPIDIHAHDVSGDSGSDIGCDNRPVTACQAGGSNAVAAHLASIRCLAPQMLPPAWHLPSPAPQQLHAAVGAAAGEFEQRSRAAVADAWRQMGTEASSSVVEVPVVQQQRLEDHPAPPGRVPPAPATAAAVTQPDGLSTFDLPLLCSAEPAGPHHSTGRRTQSVHMAVLSSCLLASTLAKPAATRPRPNAALEPPAPLSGSHRTDAPIQDHQPPMGDPASGSFSAGHAAQAAAPAVGISVRKRAKRATAASPSKALSSHATTLESDMATAVMNARLEGIAETWFGDEVIARLRASASAPAAAHLSTTSMLAAEVAADMQASLLGATDADGLRLLEPLLACPPRDDAHAGHGQQPQAGCTRLAHACSAVFDTSPLRSRACTAWDRFGMPLPLAAARAAPARLRFAGTGLNLTELPAADVPVASGELRQPCIGARASLSFATESALRARRLVLSTQHAPAQQALAAAVRTIAPIYSERMLESVPLQLSSSVATAVASMPTIEHDPDDEIPPWPVTLATASASPADVRTWFQQLRGLSLPAPAVVRVAAATPPPPALACAPSTPSTHSPFHCAAPLQHSSTCSDDCDDVDGVERQDATLTPDRTPPPATAPARVSSSRCSTPVASLVDLSPTVLATATVLDEAHTTPNRTTGVHDLTPTGGAQPHVVQTLADVVAALATVATACQTLLVRWAGLQAAGDADGGAASAGGIVALPAMQALRDALRVTEPKARAAVQQLYKAHKRGSVVAPAAAADDAGGAALAAKRKRADMTVSNHEAVTGGGPPSETLLGCSIILHALCWLAQKPHLAACAEYARRVASSDDYRARAGRFVGVLEAFAAAMECACRDEFGTDACRTAMHTITGFRELLPSDSGCGVESEALDSSPLPPSPPAKRRALDLQAPDTEPIDPATHAAGASVKPTAEPGTPPPLPTPAESLVVSSASPPAQLPTTAAPQALLAPLPPTASMPVFATPTIIRARDASVAGRSDRTGQTVPAPSATAVQNPTAVTASPPKASRIPVAAAHPTAAPRTTLLAHVRHLTTGAGRATPIPVVVGESMLQDVDVLRCVDGPGNMPLRERQLPLALDFLVGDAHGVTLFSCAACGSRKQAAQGSGGHARTAAAAAVAPPLASAALRPGFAGRVAAAGGAVTSTGSYVRSGVSAATLTAMTARALKPSSLVAVEATAPAPVAVLLAGAEQRLVERQVAMRAHGPQDETAARAWARAISECAGWLAELHVVVRVPAVERLSSDAGDEGCDDNALHGASRAVAASGASSHQLPRALVSVMPALLVLPIRLRVHVVATLDQLATTIRRIAAASIVGAAVAATRLLSVIPTNISRADTVAADMVDACTERPWLNDSPSAAEQWAASIPHCSPIAAARIAAVFGSFAAFAASSIATKQLLLGPFLPAGVIDSLHAAVATDHGVSGVSRFAADSDEIAAVQSSIHLRVAADFSRADTCSQLPWFAGGTWHRAGDPAALHAAVGGAAASTAGSADGSWRHMDWDASSTSSSSAGTSGDHHHHESSTMSLSSLHAASDDYPRRLVTPSLSSKTASAGLTSRPGRAALSAVAPSWAAEADIDHDDSAAAEVPFLRQQRGRRLDLEASYTAEDDSMDRSSGSSIEGRSGGVSASLGSGWAARSAVNAGATEHVSRGQVGADRWGMRTAPAFAAAPAGAAEAAASGDTWHTSARAMPTSIHTGGQATSFAARFGGAPADRPAWLR